MRGFGALAQVMERTAIPFLLKFDVPLAKCIGADMLEFTAPEIGEDISDRKSLKSAAKIVGKPTLKKQLGEGSPRRTRFSKQRRIIPTKSTSNSVGCEEIFLQTFLVDHVKQKFLVPTFCDSVWNSWRESPNC